MCFLWYSIVLLKKKISSLRNPTHKKRNTNKYSYNRRPQGLYFKHSVLLLNHVFPFIFRNMLVIPVVYSTVGCDILPLRCCFLQSWDYGKKLNDRRGHMWLLSIDQINRDNKSNPAAFKPNLLVYFWNTSVMIVHHLYVGFSLVHFILFS